MSAKKIILAEDEATERDIMCRALSMLGYEVFAAENGRQALDHYKAEGADLILSDIQMPEMSGLDLLIAIRELGDDLPFVLITGFNASDAKAVAEKYRASALLMKPFRVPHLRNLLTKLFSDPQDTD